MLSAILGPGTHVIAWFAHPVATDPDMYMLVSTPLSNLFEPCNQYYHALCCSFRLFPYYLVRPNREVGHFLRCWVTSLLPQLHDWLEVGKTGGQRPCGKKVLPPTPPRSQLRWTACHPVQPSHAIQASPWANKDPFQASPHCDRAEQKQSVPLGCSLWSDPAFSLAAALPVCPTPRLILLFEF